MALKKSHLYRSLWASCDALRGGMDASQYKDYVLVVLFVKYVSDKYGADPHAPIVVPESGGFRDLVALKNTKEIGDGINKVIGRLAEVNGLKGTIDVADFNDEAKLGKGKEMVERLTSLIAIFEKPELDFSRNLAGGDDLLGDAYEYLMRHFATESGKSKGQFYTPAEVSRIMARVVGIRHSTSQTETLYDPTCGSGSLLIKAADEAPHGITIYGQDKDVSTTALARMNMILHGHPDADVAPGGSSTLAEPHFLDGPNQLKRFDFIVANPPFSTKAWTTGVDASDPFGRFEGFGMPPEKNGDYAFLLHIVRSLKGTGTAAVILPHGVLFRGGKEGTIRQKLLERGLLKGIIGLPANLFYGTSIPACILVLDKKHAAGRRGVFMIDASRGFVKDGPKNRLREQDLHRIVDTFERGDDVPRFARLVAYDEIARNGFNLNLPRYIDASDAEDRHDLGAHLGGGLPVGDIDALSDFWKVMPTLRRALVEPDREGYVRLTVAPTELRATILGHEDHAAFAASLLQRYDAWEAQARETLRAFGVGGDPKALIHGLSESLLAAFEALPLLDPYAVYQHLMTYWAETMQDDAYLVAADGWKAMSGGQPNTDLVPIALVGMRFFPAQMQALGDAVSAFEAATQALDDFDEENSGEDGLLDEARSEKGKVTRALVLARLKTLPKTPENAEERAALTRYRDLLADEVEAKAMVKRLRESLSESILRRFKTLTEGEVTTLVVDDKWLARLRSDVLGEEKRVFAGLTTRLTMLAERYNDPLPSLAVATDSAAARVAAHMQTMGLSWN